jgi:hypothetical protein
VGRRNDDGGISGIEIDPAKCVYLMPHWFQIALEHPCAKTGSGLWPYVNAGPASCPRIDPGSGDTAGVGGGSDTRHRRGTGSRA